MNRYPLWKNILVAIALVLGLLYTLPNFFGETPAVQVSSTKSAVKVDTQLLGRVEDALKAGGIEYQGLFADHNSIRVRLASTDIQLKAKDVIEKALNPVADDAAYSVALNMLSSSPAWLTSMGALPMYLGLDLRGGVHFLLQVDMKGALTKRLDSIGGDIRTTLRDKNLRPSISRDGNALTIMFRDADSRNKAKNILADNLPDLTTVEQDEGGNFKLVATLKLEAQRKLQEYAIKQNITTLHNRINELGVAEPIIQQQGSDRIVVQLPGVQDTSKAKDLLGRTATLEIRMVDEENSVNPIVLEQASRGQPPFGSEYYIERGGRPLLVKKQVVLTGERLTDAQPGFDSQTHEAAVHLTLDAAGARIFKDLTRENVGKRMAILLIEKGKGEVVTAPNIRTEIAGGRVQISGAMSTEEANTIALLLRAGSLAAPMEIIEERTIGPTLGAENISKGFHST
ncbi:MAG TPA: protein translocase subunit SecD, partial [Rhodocyclaceae bacterium]|nr:protein translocase subunit SecD [Rhodocyclaceae bacterium]